MIDHGRFRQLAAGAVDFDLVETERTELDAHLAGCDACRAYAAALVADAGDLGTLPQVDAPGRVRRAVVAGRRQGRRASYGPLAAAVSVVALVILPLGVGVLLLGGFGLGFGSSGAGPGATIVPAPPTAAASGAPSAVPSVPPTASPEPSPTPSASPSPISRIPASQPSSGPESGSSRHAAPEADAPWILRDGDRAAAARRRPGT